MGLSLYTLFVAVALVLNALAILSENRFLSKFGLSTNAAYNQKYGSSGVGDGDTFGSSPFGGEDAQTHGTRSSSPLKMQIAHLLSSVRTLLRWPLIFVNSTLIVLALIFG